MKVFKKTYLLTLMAVVVSVLSALPAFAAFEKVYEAEAAPMSQSRSIGKADNGAWVLESNGNSGHAIYGPYAKDIPTGELFVKFYMKITEDKGEAGDRVFNLDARDASADKTLGEKSVNRGDFKTVGDYQVFVIPINNTTAGNELELRIWYDGNVAAAVDKIVVSDSASAQGSSASDDAVVNPKTGDTGYMAWIMAAAASVVLLLLAVKGRKTRSN